MFDERVGDIQWSYFSKYEPNQPLPTMTTIEVGDTVWATSGGLEYELTIFNCVSVDNFIARASMVSGSSREAVDHVQHDPDFRSERAISRSQVIRCRKNLANRPAR